MTRPARRSDIAHIAQEIRHVGELLLHKCVCDRDRCTLGDHLWRSTRDMAPGLQASNTDPRVHAWPNEDEATEADAATHDHDAADTTANQFHEYQDGLTAIRDAGRRLDSLIQRLRPDRTVPLITPGDDIWCRSHLRIGRCEPRHRGDLCRWCADFHYEQHLDPPIALLKARHDGQRITQQMVDSAILTERKETRRKRRKTA